MRLFLAVVQGRRETLERVVDAAGPVELGAALFGGLAERDRAVAGEPADVFFDDLLVDGRLDSGELGALLLLDVVEVLDVAHDVVFVLDVVFEAVALPVEPVARDVANEADVLLVELDFLALVAQLFEGVEDDAEEDVHADDVQDDEGEDVVEPAHVVLDPVLVRVALPTHHVSDAA